ncbi:hypothetical protein D3C71_1798700 [compost metagenome]
MSFSRNTIHAQPIFNGRLMPLEPPVQLSSWMTSRRTTSRMAMVASAKNGPRSRKVG